MHSASPVTWYVVPGWFSCARRRDQWFGAVCSLGFEDEEELEGWGDSACEWVVGERGSRVE